MKALSNIHAITSSMGNRCFHSTDVLCLECIERQPHTRTDVYPYNLHPVLIQVHIMK